MAEIESTTSAVAVMQKAVFLGKIEGRKLWIWVEPLAHPFLRAFNLIHHTSILNDNDFKSQISF